jgi:hypothetical protein
MPISDIESLSKKLKPLYDSSYLEPATKPCPHCVPGLPECAFCGGKGVVPDYDDPEDGEEME